jgi:hypothetical protein
MDQRLTQDQKNALHRNGWGGPDAGPRKLRLSATLQCSDAAGELSDQNSSHGSVRLIFVRFTAITARWAEPFAKPSCATDRHCVVHPSGRKRRAKACVRLRHASPEIEATVISRRLELFCWCEPIHIRFRMARLQLCHPLRSRMHAGTERTARKRRSRFHGFRSDLRPPHRACRLAAEGSHMDRRGG